MLKLRGTVGTQIKELEATSNRSERQNADLADLKRRFEEENIEMC